MKHPAKLGTVSQGTLRQEDLLSSFASALEGLCLVNGDALSLPENFRKRDHYAALVGEAQDAFASDGETLTEEGEENASDIISDLIDALSDFAPTGAHFGAHEGDGSDFGFWANLIGEGETPEGFADYVLPAAWASCLVNGDASGLEPSDEVELNAFLLRETGIGPCVDCSAESFFSRHPDAGMAGDCLSYRFPLSR